MGYSGTNLLYCLNLLKQLVMRKLIVIALMILPPVIMKGQDMSRYSGSWNTPTISHSSTAYKYAYFGMADPYSRHPTLDLSSLPAIPGLKYRSCYVCCKDTCVASRAIIAVRCPKEHALLRWVSTRAEWFCLFCEDDFDAVYAGEGRGFSSVSQLLNHYASRLEKQFKSIDCDHTGSVPNSQYAILITDCFRTKRYCTFYETSWVDCISNGNTVRETYTSVNNLTGKAATITDLVYEKYLAEFAGVMLGYLKNDSGHYWKDDSERYNSCEPLDILLKLDGCGLIAEGICVNFHPYTIGAGCEAQFNAIIPYVVANKYLKDY